MPTLKLRRIAIDTYKENVAYLHRECATYRSEGFQALNKIEIRNSRDARPVVAVLNIVDDANIVAPVNSACVNKFSPSLTCRKAIR